MKYIIAFVIAVVAGFFAKVEASECRTYTSEQQQVIQNAYSSGLPFDYGYTLAAITVKESFVGNRIIRYNPQDPSTGVTHIQFATLKHLSGENHWGALVLAEQLVVDDMLSFEYSVKKLDSIQGTWWNKWKRYNGNGPAAEAYARDVQGIIKGLKRCKIVGEWG